MSRRRRRLLAVAAFLFALLAGGLWLLTPGPPEFPASTFFPPNVSAAIRLNDFGAAYARHWSARGVDEWAALRKALEAAGVWEDWAEEEGDEAARKRLERLRDAGFALLGKETWVALGEWPAEGGEPAKVALTIFVQQDSILKGRISMLAGRLLPGSAAKRLSYRDATIFLGVGEGLEGTIALASVGGWICCTIGDRGDGKEAPRAMRGVVDALAQARKAKAEGTKIEERFEFAGAAGGYAAEYRPAEIERQYDQLRRALEDEAGKDKENEKEKDEEKRRKRKEDDFVLTWAERFEGFESVTAIQEGETLFDVTLQLRGERVKREAIFSEPMAAALASPDGATTPAASLGPCLVQMDFAAPFAKGAEGIFGFDWEEVLDAAEGFEWVQPGFGPALRARLGESASDARLGWALYPNHEDPLPSSAIWWDAAPTRRMAAAPADAWRALAAGEGDSFAAFAPVVYKIKAAPGVAQAKRALADRLWAEGDSPPLAFMAVHFDDLAEAIRAFPAIVIKKKKREEWKEWRRTAEAAEAVIGSLAARLDREEDELILRARSLRMR